MKTIELLNKATELGFDREKPLAEEEINEKLALNILFGFKCNKECD